MHLRGDTHTSPTISRGYISEYPKCILLHQNLSLSPQAIEAYLPLKVGEKDHEAQYRNPDRH